MKTSFILAVLCAAAIPAFSADTIYNLRLEKELPEGNYDVSVRFGSKDMPTSNWVKAESRRLMLDKVSTKPGEFVTKTFTVNIRTPEINGGGRVALKQKEDTRARWDKKLSLEIFSTVPIHDIPEIEPAKPPVVIYLAGDSTVTDQDDEPWATWGMMLPAFFQAGTVVANHGESGLALSSFMAQKRLIKILSTLKEGDYVFIQFGHNDQKEKGADAGADKGYSRRLAEFIDAVQKKGAHPVVVAPVERRRFRDGKPYTTLDDYAAAARRVAAEKKTPLIDLQAMSLKFYTALGEKKSTSAFVHYPANTFPNQPQPLKDDTHHNVYGGYELAKCIVEGIRANLPDLAKRLRPGLPAFDPSKPDASIDIPASAAKSAVKPDGQ